MSSDDVAAPTPSGSRRALRAAEQARVRASRTTRRRFRSMAVTMLAVVCTPATLLVGSANAEPAPGATTSLAPGATTVSTAAAAPFSNGAGGVSFAISGRPVGGPLYLGAELRRTGSSLYRTKVRVNPDGSVRLGLSRVLNGTETSLGTVPVRGVVVSGPVVLNVQGAISGTTSVQLGGRVWLAGTPAPSTYPLVRTDPTAASVSGTVRSWAYLSALATAPVTVRPLAVVAQPAGGTTPGATPGATPSPLPTAPPTSVTPSPGPTAAPTKQQPAPAPKPVAVAPTTPAAAPAAPAGGTAGAGTTATPSSGKPDSSNTGVPAGVSLKRHDGDLVITRDNAVYDALDIHGFVYVKASNVTLKRSIVRGGKASGNLGLVTVTDPDVRNFVIEDSDLKPAYPSVWLDNLKGANFTARRIDASGGVDAVKVHGSNVTIQNSYLHGTQYYASDPNQDGGPTHNDGVQVLGGDNITISGNTIVGGPNAALQVTQDFAATTDLVFTGNWVSGGDCTLNLNNKGAGAMGPLVVKNNVFGGSDRPGCAITRSSLTTVAMAGNVWAGTGDAVVARTSG